MQASEMKFAEIEGIIPSDAAAQILNTISLGITNFDLESLSIFSHISSHLSHDDHLTMFTLLPNALLNYIVENYHITFPLSNSEKDPVELPLESTEMSYKIKNNDFNYNPATFQFPEKLEFEAILGPEMVTKLGLLISASNCEQSLFNLLVDSLVMTLKSIKEKPYYYELASALLFICYTLKDLDFSKELCSALASEPFFDPRICVQDQIEGFEVVDSMRSIILEIGVFNHDYLCQILVKKWNKYPRLFAEIIHRFARHSLSETGASGLTTPICDVIPSVLLYYQQIFFKNPSPEICQVRSMLFLMLSHLFEHKEALIVFLSSPVFVPVYLSFVFENNLRNFILSHIRNFLSENTIPQCLVDSIDQILAISSTYINDEGYLKIMNDIFSMINEVLMHNRGQIGGLTPLSQRIYDILPKLSDADLSREILTQIISFVSYTAEPYSMRSVQSNAFMVAIENTCNSVTPPNLESKLMQLMTGEILVSIAPSYVIKQPHAVRLYFEASISYIFRAENYNCDLTKALEAIKYIDQIVTTSSANARAVQQCGLDMYVLDLLKKAKDGPAEITEGLLAIFYKIALVVSHVNAAQRYISLLAPIKGRYIPKHQGLYLKYMNKILADSLKNPTGYLQIQDNRSAIDIYGITGDMVSAGFSFCFWVFIDPANASYKPAILTMTDSQNRKLVWFISSQNLYLTQRTTNFESTGRVEVILPALQWTLVTVSYNSTQTEATVRTFINNEEKKRLEFIPMNFSNGNLTVRIGGLESETTTITKQFTRIAAFGMFNTLHFDQVSQIYATGPQLHGVFPIKPMFAYKLVGSSDDSTLSKKYALPDIEFSMADLARSPQTFSTSLLVYCKIEMLLPLLAQFDMTFEDGTPMSDIKMLVFEVLGHALIGNEDAQADFHQSEGFSVVAHLLMSINASNINYQLYMQFFALLQRINGSDLIHDIIKYVMINVEILMRADAEEHLKIIRHWARVLVPSYRRFVSKCLSFRRCLSILRLYYYYTPCESPQIMGLNRPKDLQVKDCRLSLFTAAMDAASNQFTIDDFMLIIGHCLTIIEDQQVYELLEFLTNIVNKIPQQFQPLAAQIDMQLAQADRHLSHSFEVRRNLFTNDALKNIMIKILELLIKLLVYLGKLPD